MSKVILKGFILVPEPELFDIRRALIDHTQLTQQEPGCITFSVKQNTDNPCRFDVYEEFVNKAAFEYHQQRVKSSYWGEVSVNVERFYQVTE